MASIDADVRCYLIGSCPKPERVEDGSPELDTCDECVERVTQIKETLTNEVEVGGITDQVCGFVGKVVNNQFCKSYVTSFLVQYGAAIAGTEPKEACASLKLCKQF